MTTYDCQHLHLDSLGTMRVQSIQVPWHRTAATGDYIIYINRLPHLTHFHNNFNNTFNKNMTTDPQLTDQIVTKITAQTRTSDVRRIVDLSIWCSGANNSSGNKKYLPNGETLATLAWYPGTGLACVQPASHSLDGQSVYTSYQYGRRLLLIHTIHIGNCLQLLLKHITLSTW